MRYAFILFLGLALSPLSAQNVNVVFKDSIRFAGKYLSNIWGYTAGGKEYALVGREDGVSIVDVTTPTNVIHKQFIPGTSSSWREIKTYSNYAYIVSEASDSLIIVNLSSLPGTIPASGIKKYRGNGAILNLLRKAHALQVDESTGYLYLYGTNLCSGQALCFSLADPWNPNYISCVNYNGYVHDGYANNDVLYASNIYAGKVTIFDMTDKFNPNPLGEFNTPGNFTHNTWLDGTTLFTTDEVNNSYLTAYNISNPGNPSELDRIQSNPGSNSMVHNTYIKNSYAITSWYRDGFTIVDVSRPANLVQVGNYDTYLGTGGNYDGAWGVYPYFPSGTIVVSNISNMLSNGNNNHIGELWVFTPTYQRGCYIEGIVKNTANQPLSGAFVELVGTSTNQNTSNSPGSLGTYKMGQLQSGTYTFKVTLAGYQTYQQSISISNGVLTTVNVTLQSVPIPVELLRFDANASGNQVLLNWETQSEANNNGFEIQHSTSLNEWSVLGFENARGTASHYEFQVDALEPGTHYFRLKQIDLDGKENWSEIKRVELLGKPQRLRMQPSIVQDEAVLHLEMEYDGPVQVDVLDLKGNQTALHWVVEHKDHTEFPLQMAGLSSGLYCLRVQAGQKQLTYRFFKE